jgi:hypothetical protein
VTPRLGGLLAAALAAVTANGAAAVPANPSACEEAPFGRELGGRAVTWTRLAPGVRLGSGDAIQTCPGSEVLVSASARFGWDASWERQATHWLGTVPSDVLVVIGIERASPVSVDVLHVTGGAFYSTDREPILASGIEGIASLPEGAWRREQSERYDSLMALHWTPLAAGDRLDPWDILWVQPGGWVEIEVLGFNGLINEGHDVIGANGRPTGRKRYGSSYTWLVHPDFFEAARVVDVVGEVWRTTEPDRVRAHFDRDGRLSGIVREPVAEPATVDGSETRAGD